MQDAGENWEDNWEVNFVVMECFTVMLGVGGVELGGLLTFVAPAFVFACVLQSLR